MQDLANAPSNGATDEVVSAATETPVSPSPAPSAREAIERAMQSVGDAPDSTKAQRDRDEAGRFATKTDQDTKAPTTGQGGQVQPAATVDAPSIAAPPQRLAKAAQEAWAQVPDVVRAEVTRMEVELTKGLGEYQQRWEPLKQYDDMARQGGTTLHEALNLYTNMENLLRADPVRGFTELCRNGGIDPKAIGQALLGMEVAGGDTPHVAALKSELQALKEQIGGVSHTLSQRDIMAQVESFAKDRPHFDALSESIAHMLQTGFAKDLPDAYDKALRLNPDVAAKVAADKTPPEVPAQPKTPEAAQTRKASLSITGSPANGSNPGSRKPAGSTRDALTSAFSQVGLT